MGGYLDMCGGGDVVRWDVLGIAGVGGGGYIASCRDIFYTLACSFFFSSCSASISLSVEAVWKVP